MKRNARVTPKRRQQPQLNKHAIQQHLTQPIKDLPPTIQRAIERRA